MKAQPLKRNVHGYVACSLQEATYVMLNTPGPIPTRILPIVNSNIHRTNIPEWKWNGDTEKPTISPSILSDNQQVRCHSFVREGKIEFLNDCTHEHAGQTLDLLDVDF
jgi:hypothetical protein